jgi:hypothetical protein
MRNHSGLFLGGAALALLATAATAAPHGKAGL